MKKPIELHKILELADEDSHLDWVAENHDIGDVIERYGNQEHTGMQIAMLYKSIDDLMKDVQKTHGNELVEWIGSNIPFSTLKEILHERRFD